MPSSKRLSRTLESESAENACHDHIVRARGGEYVLIGYASHEQPAEVPANSVPTEGQIYEDPPQIELVLGCTGRRLRSRKYACSVIKSWDLERRNSNERTILGTMKRKALRLPNPLP